MQQFWFSREAALSRAHAPLSLLVRGGRHEREASAPSFTRKRATDDPAQSVVCPHPREVNRLGSGEISSRSMLCPFARARHRYRQWDVTSLGTASDRGRRGDGLARSLARRSKRI